MKFLIIGAGSVGTSLAERLTSTENEVVLIDQSQKAIKEISTKLDIQIVKGNGCDPKILISAGIENADYFIAVTDDDETNMAACLVSKALNEKAKRIARIRKISFDYDEVDTTEIENIFDLIINPDLAAADYLTKLLKVPGAYDVIEFAQGRLKAVALEISEKSEVANKKISSLKEEVQDIPLLLNAIVRDNVLILPRRSDRIRVGDLIYCLTYPKHINRLLEIAGQKPHILNNIMIWGDTGFARALAHNLENNNLNVKLIVPKVRSNEIIEEFEETLLVEGDITNQNLLLEENIHEADAFLALGEEEEENILAALLSKKLGADFCVALINKSSYLPIVNSIGVDTVVNSYLAASLAIFKFIYAGSIISASSLVHTEASYIEIIADAKISFIDKKIKDINIPYGILITAIIRDEEVIIPTGEDIIRMGDRIVIFYISSAVSKLEKILNIKLQLFI